MLQYLRLYFVVKAIPVAGKRSNAATYCGGLETTVIKGKINNSPVLSDYEVKIKLIFGVITLCCCLVAKSCQTLATHGL